MAGHDTGRDGWGVTYDASSPVGKIGAGLSTMARLIWFGRGSRLDVLLTKKTPDHP